MLKQKEHGMSSEPSEPVVLINVRTEMEATAIVNALAARDIPATCQGALTSAFRAEVPGGVGIVVRGPDLARAKLALAAVQRDLSEIDWSQVDVGEPES
jgi:FAD/FMN-containing dehydrogenase